LSVKKVGVFDDFFELGGDSLQSIEVIALAKKDNLSIEVRDIFLLKTVSELAKEAQSPKKEEEPISINKEAFLEEEIVPLKKNNNMLDKNILLTGATGFLGSYILSELLIVEKYNIFCLVRCDNKEEGFLRIKEKLMFFSLWKDTYTKRIIVVKGDLSLEKMGIENNIYFDLSEKITKIYHAATYMNSLVAYDTLKSVNVDGVRRIIKFSSIGRSKTIEYISTIDIFSKSKYKIVDESSLLEDQIHYPSKGYSSSKYIAEGIIEIAKKRGFHINIYRVGLITGDTRIGENEKSQWFYNFLHGVDELKCITNDLNFFISMVPVNYVAKSIITLSERKSSEYIFHITIPFLVDFIDLIKNLDIKVLNLYDFAIKIDSYNKINKKLSFFTSLLEDSFNHSKKEFKKFDKNNEKPDLFIQSFKTRKILKQYGLDFPLIDENLIKLYLEKMEEN